MTITVLTKTLRDNRRGLLGWTLGITAAATAYASFYPQMAESGADQAKNLPDALREALRMDDITSAPGYLGSTVFGLIVPLLVMFFGATLGARSTAADEEAGTLDLLMAHPITRTTLILQRFAALAVAATGIGVVVWLAMLAIRGSAELTAISPAQLAAQCVNVVLLAIVFGAIATGVGAATGRRTVVLAVTATLGVLSYGTHTFAGQLGLDWAAYLSPFHYYLDGEPLRTGFQWTSIAVLTAASALLVAAGTFRFNHRDLNA
ncbi:ABC transporter permease subunit [Nocardia amamiensis]|uniref:ABC transporter permease subunit n=1 Tax=Nocardia amamiensis TaxID=404578 RepID=UPI0033C97FBC